MNIKSIGITWLSKADLSNVNAGEGSSNIVELKTYDNGHKPYASGQSVRHALREAISRLYPDAFDCTPEAPCGKIDACWLCDLFGFLAPKADIGADRRWSALKVSPALGLYRKEIVTDLLLRMSDIEKGEGRTSMDQRLAYIQLVENTYKLGMVVDYANVGLLRLPEYSGTGKNAEFAGWKTEIDIGADARRKRVRAVLEGIGNLSDFAKQARNMVSFSPDIILMSIQPTYNQRIQRAFEVDEDGVLNTALLDTVMKDLEALGTDVALFIGFTPGVIANEEAFHSVLEEHGLSATNPQAALSGCIAALEKRG